MRGETYVFNDGNINDITCSDPPAAQTICASVYHICAQGTADKLHRLFETRDTFLLESLKLQLLV